jgi:type II secretory pathway pseudopilin PulG
MQRGSPRLAVTRGFTYVWVLAMLAAMSIGLATVGPLWAEEAQRQREDELLRVGRLYADAIANYRRISPGSGKRYPARLEELLLDTRFVGTVRHLRTLYPDPASRGQAWGLVRAADGGIQGVYSVSAAVPLRRTTVELGAIRLAPAQRYSDWLFVAPPAP